MKNIMQFYIFYASLQCIIDTEAIYNPISRLPRNFFKIVRNNNLK